MAEPDHVFVNPLPNLARDGHPAAFPFFYIKPTEHEDIIRKFYPAEKGPVSNIDPIGNSPVIIHKVRSPRRRCLQPLLITPTGSALAGNPACLRCWTRSSAINSSVDSDAASRGLFSR